MGDFERLLELEVVALPQAHWVKEALSRSALAQEVAKIEPKPSEEQKKSGNYRKGHVRWKGFELTLETGSGQTRSGVSKDGKPWSITLKDHYGYIRRTVSESDGDHLDIFLSGDEDLRGGATLRSELVFVVDQIDPATGKFDEHKCLLGFVDEDAARAAYLRNYADGWGGLGDITPFTLEKFRTWATSGDTRKPVAGQAD